MKVCGFVNVQKKNNNPNPKQQTDQILLISNSGNDFLSCFRKYVSQSSQKFHVLDKLN